MLEVKDLVKAFSGKTVIDGVDISVERGETLGLVGESGCGKTTLSRIVARLLPPDSGTILFKGENILQMSAARLKAFRRGLQIIFQDPYASMNPKMKVGQAMKEPFVIHGITGKKEVNERISKLLDDVSIPQDYLDRYPHEISGGECQRICIARSLCLFPEFIILDEPVSSLDFSIQDQIINMLMAIKARQKLTYLFITHDLELAKKICDRIAVMKDGKIVETGTTPQIFGSPKEDYTKQLIFDSLM